MRVIGVDFSGAKREVGKTWIADGRLEGSTLNLTSCEPISRANLTKKLAKLNEPAVAAMDFPFSVPTEFARFWRGDDVVNHGWGMPDLWTSAAEMELDDFRELGRRFIDRHGEPKRACDPPESFSCLHDIHPDMVPMTFWGMQMLNQLWQRTGIRVPPLHPDPERDSVTLLEVMPGATLRSLDLPYKGYKSGQLTDQRRIEILNGLPGRARPVEINLRVTVGRCHQICNVAPIGENRLPLRDICRYHDDALDAVVAAIAAALWAIPETREHFISPPHPNDPNIRLEGWLYTPGGCYLHNCVERI